MTRNTDAEKKKLATMKRNDVAMSSLALVFTTDELLDMILVTQDDDQPDRVTSKFIQQLQDKFQLVDTMALVDERIELNKIKMKKNKDSKKLF